MNKTDLDAPQNQELRAEYERQLTKRVAPGYPMLLTEEERTYVQRRYVNPDVQRGWLKFLTDRKAKHV